MLQKADGTCNTNFKKTQELEQVTKVLKEFVDGDLEVLVSRSPVHTLYPSWVEVIGLLLMFVILGGLTQTGRRVRPRAQGW